MKTMLLLGLLLNSGIVFGQIPVTAATDQISMLSSNDSQLAKNKKLVFDFWREVLQTRDMTKAGQYLSANYLQHNPNVPTGRQAFVDFFGKLKQQSLKPEIDGLVSITAERDLVVLAMRREIPEPGDPKKAYTSTWFDMFRIENDLIVEHWDYGTKVPDPPGSPAVQCEALCTFRRTDGVIERLQLLQQAADGDKAWERLKNSCRDVTCRSCLWDLVVSVQDGKEYGLRPAEQVKDCKAVRLL